MVDQLAKGGTEVLATQITSITTTINGEIQSQVDNNGPKQSPIGKRKSWKSDVEKSPLPVTRKRSGLGEQCKELGDGIKKSPAQMKKTRSLSSPQSSVRNEIPLRKAKSDAGKALIVRKSEASKNNSEASKNLVANFEDSVSLQIVNAETAVTDEEFDDKNVVDEDVGDPINMSRSDQHVGGEDEEVDKEINVEVERKILETTNITLEEKKPKKAAVKEKKVIPVDQRSAPTVKAVDHARYHPSPIPDKYSDTTRSKLQSVADLIMWRDVSRSAFVFGIGAFAIISSSYTTDLNISFISVVSYLGLVYLGISFTFKSFISRGSNDMDRTKQEYVIGEEEAVWLIQLILPYVNEFLLKLRSLFSGDPATTMKLAVILFISARCGGSITIWKMAKLGFFGVFIVPKLCSSYSPHLASYGTFWMRRFGDAWEACSNKKAVGLGIFTLVWNLCSVVARIWALFILFVGFKYYQHYLPMQDQSLQQEAVAANSVSRSSATQIKKQIC